MPRETPVRAVMTPDPLTVGPADSVVDVARVMSEQGVGGVPVVDADGGFLGMVEDDDILLEDADLEVPSYIEFLGTYITMPGALGRFEKHFKKAVAATVRDVMDTENHTIGPDETLEDAATLLTQKGVNRLAVLDENRRVVGVVARSDLVRAIARDEAR